MCHCRHWPFPFPHGCGEGVGEAVAGADGPSGTAHAEHGPDGSGGGEGAVHGVPVGGEGWEGERSLVVAVAAEDGVHGDVGVWVRRGVGGGHGAVDDGAGVGV